MTDGGIIRVSKNFRKMFEEMREQEKERTNTRPSDTTTSEILFLRIQKVGGLKKP